MPLSSKPHHLEADEVVFAFDRTLRPRLTVVPPAEVIVATLDARAGRLRRPEDVETTAPSYADRFPKTNPATGPIAIEGAEPGDAVCVDILGIELASSGYTLLKPGFGVVPDLVERPIARICPIIGGFLHFGSLRLPVRPMIGVIATAPPGEPEGTAYIGRHGGNLDCNLATVGSRIHLPVRVAGGLLFVGDVHATMGDGEISGSGFEIGAEIRMRVALRKREGGDWPWLETKDRLVTLGAAPTFEEASDIAIRSMLDLLMKRHALSPTDAFMLMSIRGDLRVNQACRSPVDTSVRFEFPKLTNGEG